MALVRRYRADDWIPTATEALAALRVGELKKLAALVTTSSPGRKDELVALLLGHLEGDHLRALWERLGELERTAVAEVVHGVGTRFEPERFRAKYGRDPDWGSLDQYDRAAKPSPLRLFLYGSGILPDDLRERIETFVPEPPSASLETVAELPAALEREVARFDYETRRTERWTETVPLAVRETERPAQHDLEAVLRLVEAGKVSVSDKTRRPSAAAIRAVAAVLDGGDFYEDEAVGPIRAFAWPLIVQAAGLAQLSGTRLQLTKAGKGALAAPPAEALRACWRRWLDTRLLDELARVESIKGQTGRGKRGLTAVAGRRAAVAVALADCPVGRWVAVDELFRYMRAADHDFEVTRDAWGLYLAEPHDGSLGYDGCGGWEILQARYALCLLFEYAASLGLVDVAYVPPAGARDDYRKLWGADGLEFLSRYDGLAYLRLTPLGAYCLDVAGEYAPAPPQRRPVLAVAPNLELAALEPLLPGERLVLDRYAERVSELVWRLEAGRLLAALEDGGSVAELAEFLSARSVAQLPETVSRFLEDVAERGGRLRDRGAARLIECGDPALAALVANDSRTRRLCLLAGERHVVVPAASEPAFRRALRDLGYAVSALERGIAA